MIPHNLKKKMTFGSVCSGIEGASVAWEPLGWKAKWVAEIEPFPSAVIAHHYPNVPNLGDMTKIAKKIRLGKVPAPQVLVGGCPCQAFSVAGLRKSLDDHRGQLTLTYIKLANQIDETRAEHGKEPCIIVYENVPGILNAKDNPFGCFLAGLAGEDEALLPPGGKWTDAGMVLGPQRAVAWRVLDSQHFGVAQRRRRVFVVASARKGFSPSTVLFEREGVRRDTPPSREAREGVAEGSAEGPGISGDSSVKSPVFLDRAAFNQGENAKYAFEVSTRNVSAALVSKGPHAVSVRTTPAAGRTVTWKELRRAAKKACLAAGDSWVADSGTKDLYTADVWDSLGRPEIVDAPEVKAFNWTTDGEINVSPTLDARLADGPRRNQGGVCNTNPTAFPIDLRNGTRAADKKDAVNRQGAGVGSASDPACTISRSHGHGVAVTSAQAVDCYNHKVDGDVCATFGAASGGSNNAGPKVMEGSSPVRRLTPEECEALQAFPRGWTKIPWKGKPAEACPDGPRYKALGNSWTTYVVRWIGARIVWALNGADPDGAPRLSDLIELPDGPRFSTEWRAGDQANSEVVVNGTGTLNCNLGQRGDTAALPEVTFAIDQ